MACLLVFLAFLTSSSVSAAPTFAVNEAEAMRARSLELWKRRARSGATGRELERLFGADLHGRRLVLDDDDLAQERCESQIAEYAMCRDANDDDPGDDDDEEEPTEEGRRFLQEGEEDDEGPSTENQYLCADFLELQATSQDPCHDGIFDDGDAGCESELFAAYSCYFTVVCEQRFVCEDFEEDKIFDTDTVDVNGSKVVTFYNSFPSLDILVCFFFGPTWGSRHARTAGPLSYGESTHVSYEGERVYFNVHSISPQATDCSDESRRRMTLSTYVFSAYETPTNFVGWGLSALGVGQVDVWRALAATGGDVDNKIFANEANNFGDCTFHWEKNALWPDDFNAPDYDDFILGTNAALIAPLPSYDGLAALRVTCEDAYSKTASAELALPAGKFCDGASQQFMAVGDDQKAIFPLQLMLIQGLPCNGQDLDQVHAPDIIILDEAEEAPPPQEIVITRETTTTKKKESSDGVLLGLVIAFAVVIFCCAVTLAGLVLKTKPGAWHHSSMCPVDSSDDVVTIQLPAVENKNPVHADVNEGPPDEKKRPDDDDS